MLAAGTAHNPLPTAQRKPGLGGGQRLHLCAHKRTLVTDFLLGEFQRFTQLTGQERGYRRVLCAQGVAHGNRCDPGKPPWVWSEKASSWKAGGHHRELHPGRPPAFPRSQPPKQRGRPTARPPPEQSQEPSPSPAFPSGIPGARAGVGGGGPTDDQGNDLKVPATSDLQKRPSSG